MKTALICLGGAVLIAALILLALRSTRALPVEEIDRTLVDAYCRLVAQGKYAEAYAQCLTTAYRREVSRDEFAQAQRKRREEAGVLQGRELLRMKAGTSLFSGVRELQLLYLLRYPGGEERNYMVVDDADGEYRIDGTYVKPVSGLSFKVW